MQDKDNSATVEKEEMCAFAKKVINLMFRTVKNVISHYRMCSLTIECVLLKVINLMFRTVQNVLPLVAKAVSTAMSSEAVDKVLFVCANYAHTYTHTLHTHTLHKRTRKVMSSEAVDKVLFVCAQRVCFHLCLCNMCVCNMCVCMFVRWT